MTEQASLVSEYYKVGDEVVIYELELGNLSYELEEMSIKHGRVIEINTFYAVAEYTGVPGEKGHMNIGTPYDLVDNTEDAQSRWLNVVALKGGEARALALIYERVDQIAQRFDVIRSQLRQDLGIPEQTPSLRDVNLQTAMMAAEMVTPCTALVHEIPRKLPSSFVVAKTLKEEISAKLRENDYEAIAERFEDASQDIKNLYPMIILAAAYVRLELAGTERDIVGALANEIEKAPLIFVHRDGGELSYEHDNVRYDDKAAVVHIATQVTPNMPPIFIDRDKNDVRTFTVFGKEYYGIVQANEYAVKVWQDFNAKAEKTYE